ncbi:MAG: hypothetical protein HUU02_14130 [Bacteroidetes bacterium]|nr:hypothetical protein [Bacteroidota bacterium]
MLRSILLFFICSLPLTAQSLKFRHLGIEQGLSQSSVMCMLQDSDGFLWFGTWDGLNRYDGYTFVHYRHDPQDSSTLSNNSIIAMAEAPDGKLWIGTATRGINVLDRRNGEVQRLPLYPTDVVGPSVFHMIDSFTMAVGMIHGVLKYDIRDPMKTPVHEQSDSLAIYYLNDKDRTEWTVQLNGIIRRSASGRRTFHPFDPAALGLPASSTLFHLYSDRYGTLWVSTFGGGLIQFDADRSEFRRPNFARLGLTSRTVRFVTEDRQGRFWVGTEDGLFRAVFSGEGAQRRILRFEHFRRETEDPNSLSSNAVYSLMEDRTGVIWIGTNVGLNTLLPERKRFTTVKNTSLLGKEFHSHFPVAIFDDGDSILWVSTQKHLYRFDGRHGAWHRYSSRTTGLSNDQVYRIFKDSQARLWVATRFGLNLYHPGNDRFESIIFPGPEKDLPFMNRIFDMTEDEDGKLWLATIRGVVRYDPATGRSDRYLDAAAADSQRYNYIISLNAHKEHLWVGTNAKGLVRLRRSDGGIDTVLMPVNSSAAGGAYMELYRDSHDILWAATMGQGIIRIDEREKEISVRRYSVREGLPNDYAYGILEDEQGHLWISTNNGLARFDPETEQFTTYTTRDGLPTNEFNQNSFHRSPDGSMYFGGINGIVRFHPRDIRHNDIPPPVVITSFAVTNDPRPDLLRRGEAVLKHTENYFSFEFAALCFEVPANNRYAYKLEGLEVEWNEVGTRRFANYTDIDPGEYTFRVKGTNNDGVWNEQGASFRIVIVPPFYATVWFRVLVALAVIGGVAGGVRYAAARKYRRTIEALEQQKRLLEERQRVRDKIARDLHDDLASTVGSAGLFIETAKRTLSDDPAQSREFLEKTSSILTEAEEAMSDIVWSVSPKHDTVQSLAVRIRIVTTDLCRANGISGTVEMNGNLDQPLTDDVRRGLYLIFKEALTNSVRHSRTASVEVSIGADGNEVLLSVKDHGIGFDISSRQETLGGNGMVNIRKRAEEIGAQCTITSVPGKGTAVEIRKELTQLGH